MDEEKNKDMIIEEKAKIKKKDNSGLDMYPSKEQTLQAEQFPK